VRPPVADPGKAITDQTEDVILSIAPRYGEQWKKGEPAEVEIIFDSSRHDADSAMHRLSDMVNRVGQREASLRLFARGISPKVVVPITISNRDQATAQSRSQILFSMMPYLFIMSLFIGGMYLAIDTTAGERERQSLEPLFANPVSRTYILLGKVCATFTFSTMSLCISMGAFAIAARIMPIAELGMSFSIGPRFVGGVLLVMLPVVVLLGSMQTLVAAFAKSYREAQTYQSILLLLPALPSALFAALPLKAQLWMYAIPLIGQQLTVMRLVRGEGIDVAGALLCVACTSLAGIIAFSVTAIVYRSERLAISA
jgi:sodium transport system permease protein